MSELAALQGLPAQMSVMREEIVQLRRELEALRGMHSQTMEVVGDIRRLCKK